MRIEVENTYAVVVDYQERLMPVMSEKEKLTEAAGILLAGLRVLEVPICVTQQYTKGLGLTIPEIQAAWTDEEAADAGFPYIDKTSFSVCGDDAFAEAIKDADKKQIILCGIESHVCVLLSALDFLSEDYDVFLVSDAVSSRYETDCAGAVSRMAQAGAVVTTTESILFELLGSAKHPCFKDISNLIK